MKAKAFVAKLSDDEKVNLTAGVTSNTGCSGNIQAIERLGFPGMCVSDAGNGLVSTNPLSAALFVHSNDGLINIFREEQTMLTVGHRVSPLELGVF